MELYKPGYRNKKVCIKVFAVGVLTFVQIFRMLSDISITSAGPAEEILKCGERCHLFN